MKRMIIDSPLAAASGAPARTASGPPAVGRAGLEPVRTRRRPLLMGLGVALTAVGGLGAAWLASTGTGTVSVVGVAHEIHAGQVIHRQDLVGVQIAAGSALTSLPVHRADQVVGKRSLVHLLRGSLLNPDAVADRVVPAAGQALVGLELGPGQRPAVPLETGDPVEIVYVSGTPDASASGSTQPPAVLGVVVSTEDHPDTDKTVVNVTVSRDAAVKVASWGSAGRATIALLPATQS
ncbi:MAG: hypothetical protein ACXV0U_02285 [Kineosporiaceae bacterium]